MTYSLVDSYYLPNPRYKFTTRGEIFVAGMFARMHARSEYSVDPVHDHSVAAIRLLLAGYEGWDEDLALDVIDLERLQDFVRMLRDTLEGEFGLLVPDLVEETYMVYSLFLDKLPREEIEASIYKLLNQICRIIVQYVPWSVDGMGVYAIEDKNDDEDTEVQYVYRRMEVQ